MTGSPFVSGRTECRKISAGCEFHQSAKRACANAVATCAKWETAKCTNGRNAAVCAWRHLPQAPPELAHRARVGFRVRVSVRVRVGVGVGVRVRVIEIGLGLGS